MIDQLGDRMKQYEKSTPSIQWSGLSPIIARIDGRAFHSATSKCIRPFDNNLIEIMNNTAWKLAYEFHPLITYVQSDEISLVFYAPNELSQLPFNGKMIKLTSILASATTAYFNEEQLSLETSNGESGYECTDIEYYLNKPQQFDCRVFEVPDISEATNYLLWRQRDCSRNSILSVAQYKFGHKKIHGKDCQQLLKDLEWIGHPWDINYSNREKYGQFIIPEEKTLLNDEGEKYTRNYLSFFKIPDLNTISHEERMKLLFPKYYIDENIL